MITGSLETDAVTLNEAVRWCTWLEASNIVCRTILRQIGPWRRLELASSLHRWAFCREPAYTKRSKVVQTGKVRRLERGRPNRSDFPSTSAQLELHRIGMRSRPEERLVCCSCLICKKLRINPDVSRLRSSERHRITELFSSSNVVTHDRTSRVRHHARFICFKSCAIEQHVAPRSRIPDRRFPRSRGSPVVGKHFEDLSRWTGALVVPSPQ